LQITFTNVAGTLQERSENIKKFNVQITFRKTNVADNVAETLFLLSTLQITLQKVVNVADNVVEKTPFFEFLNV
jgi:hypothetical protein